eukprot:TRINITY_DN25324_c0_g1_i1.p1 TRINITY_DN25324_c0_g1~~TRINITY_DN25324_c0_g1_i1.p1  ORF type:complete len:692 (-),score=116.48 TRINITY_DN25324_c0_g1_i1:682-2655(-)
MTVDLVKDACMPRSINFRDCYTPREEDIPGQASQAGCARRPTLLRCTAAGFQKQPASLSLPPNPTQSAPLMFGPTSPRMCKTPLSGTASYQSKEMACPTNWQAALDTFGQRLRQDIREDMQELLIKMQLRRWSPEAWQAAAGDSLDQERDGKAVGPGMRLESLQRSSVRPSSSQSRNRPDLEARSPLTPTIGAAVSKGIEGHAKTSQISHKPSRRSSAGAQTEPRGQVIRRLTKFAKRRGSEIMKTLNGTDYTKQGTMVHTQTLTASQRRLRAVIPIFQLCTCLGIIVNAALIGIEADEIAKGQEPSEWCSVLDWVLCVYFVVDLFVRVLFYRLEFFSGSDCGFNLLDVVLIVLHIIDNVFDRSPPEGTAHEKPGVANYTTMIRFIALGRCMRIMRVLKFVPDLRCLLYLVLGAMSALGWTIILMLIALYMPAVFIIYLLQAAGPRVLEAELDGTAAWPGATEPTSAGAGAAVGVTSAVSSLGTLMWQLFQSVTGGMDWADIITPIIQQAGQSHAELVRVVFCVFVVFTVLVLLNLVTGVFVQKAKHMSDEDQRRDLERRVTNAFNLEDEHVQLTQWQFDAYLDEPEVGEFFQTYDWGLCHKEDLFNLLDVDANGTLSLDEIVHGTTLLQQPVKKIEIAFVLAELRKLRKDISMAAY